MISRFIRWVACGIVLPIIPLVLFAFSLGISKLEISMDTLLGGGELFMIAGSLGAAAVGDVILSNEKRYQGTRNFFGMICLVVVCTSFAAYAMVSFRQVVVLDKNVVVFWSGAMFILAVFSSGFCVAITKK